MAEIVADRVLETSLTTGTGPYTLNGAVLGFRTVASVASALDTFNYFAEDILLNGAPSGGWEVGIGTVNADGSIARTVKTSSNNNLPVSWAAGTRRFGLGLSASQFNRVYVSAIQAATSLIQTQKIMAEMVLRGQA